jgi:hypothetical protein
MNKQNTIELLAREIRRVDGDHKLGASELAEKLMPFIDCHANAVARAGYEDGYKAGIESHNDQRQAREDNQGLGVPGRLSPSTDEQREAFEKWFAGSGIDYATSAKLAAWVAWLHLSKGSVLVSVDIVDRIKESLEQYLAEIVRAAESGTSTLVHRGLLSNNTN